MRKLLRRFPFQISALAIMKILGVEIMNGGYGVSIDDIVSEHAYTFIAHGMIPWRSQSPIPGSPHASGHGI